jgi:hypothetical protein
LFVLMVQRFTVVFLRMGVHYADMMTVVSAIALCVSVCERFAFFELHVVRFCGRAYFCF